MGRIAFLLLALLLIAGAPRVIAGAPRANGAEVGADAGDTVGAAASAGAGTAATVSTDQPTPAEPDTPEAWLVQRISAGEDADFNARCGTDHLDPRTSTDPRWAASCRAIRPDALRAILTGANLADHAPHGVRLLGAHLSGPVNLDDAHIAAPELTLIDCLIDGDLIMSEAHLDGSFDLDGSVVTGKLEASLGRFDSLVTFRDATRIGQAVNFDGATFKDSLSIDSAVLVGGMHAVGAEIDRMVNISGESDGDLGMMATRIGGSLSVVDLTVVGNHAVDATLMSIGGFAAISGCTFGGNVTISLSAIGGVLVVNNSKFAPASLFVAELVKASQFTAMSTGFGSTLNLRGADFASHAGLSEVTFAPNGTLEADNLRVGGQFVLLTPITFPGGVRLIGAAVARDLDLTDMQVGDGKAFSAQELYVGGDLALANATFGGDTSFKNAEIRGQFDAVGVKFNGPLTLENVRVGHDLFLRDTTAARPVVAIGLSAGSLDLRGSTLAGLDLSSAVVERDLRLGGRYDDGQLAITRWKNTGGAPAQVVLRNAKVANLQDDINAWDGTELSLQGFTYAHLGGVGGVAQQDMRLRTVAAWTAWLNRDPIFSPEPYTQLASVLSAGGNSGSASDIRFAGRDRERRDKLLGCAFLHRADKNTLPPDQTCDLGAWFGLSVLQFTIGYGIGGYTVRALWWTVVLTLVGTLVLVTAPGVRGAAPRWFGPGRQRSVLWCFGAALNHVLPVVSLSPEFSDFMNDPKGERLRPWHKVAFAALALAGWALSFFVIAAITGLTQGG